MDQPNLEACIYSHVELMQAMLKGMHDQCHLTIFENDDTRDLLKSLIVGFKALRVEFDRSYKQSNEPKSVCY